MWHWQLNYNMTPGVSKTAPFLWSNSDDTHTTRQKKETTRYSNGSDILHHRGVTRTLLYMALCFLLLVAFGGREECMDASFPIGVGYISP